MFGGCFQWQPLLSLSYTCGRCVTIASNSKSNELEINEQIRDKEIRLIGADGAQMGIMSPRDALKMAIDKDLDLVKVAPTANPPVCKIVDYGKYKYEQSRKEKESKKKQKVIEIKEVRLSPNIDKHDLEVKAKNANKFIDAGNKVKVTMRFRGRELNFVEQGKEIMSNFRELVIDAQVDKEAKMEGKNLIMFLVPKQK